MEERVRKAIKHIQSNHKQRLFEIHQLEHCPCKIRTDLFFSALKQGLYFDLHRDTNGILKERCLYICAMCDFDNFGTRTVDEGDLTHE